MSGGHGCPVAMDVRLVQRNNRYSVGELFLAMLYPMILGLERIETIQLLRQIWVFRYFTGLHAYRLSAGHAEEHTPADPPDARTVVPHPQLSSLGHACQRTAGGGLELGLASDQETQAVRGAFFTQDSGSTEISFEC
jgi:hypothetical protein